MKTYQFTLKYRLPDGTTDMDALSKHLSEVGFSDAVINHDAGREYGERTDACPTARQ